ncbi:uncharacterized protein LOC142349253 isoform X2 [Convolutriloba macropyga]
MDGSFSIFDIQYWQREKMEPPNQGPESSGPCERCKTLNDVKRTRTVKTQFPSKSLRDIDHNSVWNSEEINILREQYRKAEKERTYDKSKTAVLETQLLEADNCIADMKAQIGELTKELALHGIQSKVVAVENQQNSQNIHALSQELEELKCENQSLKEALLHSEISCQKNESEIRLKMEDNQRLSEKLSKHNIALEKAVSLKAEALQTEFSIERSKLKQEIDHLEKALISERNNHLITHRALEQLQLHFGNQDAQIRSSVELGKSPRIKSKAAETVDVNKIVY